MWKHWPLKKILEQVRYMEIQEGPVFVVAPVVHELVVLLLVPVTDKT